MAIVHWKHTDSESLGRVSILEVGSKSLTLPTRGASASGGLTSEEKIVDRYAREIHPLQELWVVYRGINVTSIRNIETSNGKFNDLRRGVQKVLEVIPKDSIRMLYLRIPKICEVHGTKIRMEHISERQAEALFDFITQFGTDIIILPIPPLIQEADLFRRIVDTYLESAETFSEARPLMGYIPNVDNPVLAGEMAAYYYENGIRVFGIDFGGGHPRRTVTTVVRALRQLGEEYYLHAFNVNPSKPSQRDVTNIMDLLVHTYGFDSFSNVGWGRGGGGLSESELRERVRFPMIEDYGSYRYVALKKLLKEKEMNDTECECPVCRNETITDLYEENNLKDLRYKVKVHRIFADSMELSNIKSRISEEEFMPYLDGKSNLHFPLRQIREDIRNINREAKTIDDY
ncbi:MAG: hypothetical protein ACE5IO_09880 [Thermoplasmata archaeon]